jgi:hypothetical protein
MLLKVLLAGILVVLVFGAHAQETEATYEERRAEITQRYAEINSRIRRQAREWNAAITIDEVREPEHLPSEH